MEPYIQISKINDFIFCPMSLYYHSIYENFSEKIYHSEYQTRGKISHKNIEKGDYSSLKRYLQGIDIYSEKYKLAGKIDIYDTLSKTVIERKYLVKKIFDGYRFQLYAQYFCLIEMGYEVKKLKIHSLADNKNYIIPLPEGDRLNKFKNIIKAMYEFNPRLKIRKNKNKCARCVYGALCIF